MADTILIEVIDLYVWEPLQKNSRAQRILRELDKKKVDELLEGSGSIHASATPSGKAVTTLYIGPYEEVEPAYDFLMKWCADNSLILNGVACEIYLNDPSQTPPEMLKTQVSLLLKEG